MPADATPFLQRKAHFTMNVHTRWEDPAKDEACISWARELFDRAAPFSAGSVYVNFIPDDEPDRLVARLWQQPRAAEEGEGHLRQRQPLPLQPQHPAERDGAGGRIARSAPPERSGGASDLAAAGLLRHQGGMADPEIELAGTLLTARASGALWWEAERLLCVADLHLCRSERLARRGGTLLPPYETAETLDRLGSEIAALAPRKVLCLGDSFDDCAAGEALASADKARLQALMAGREWIWVAGNHDPAPLSLDGQYLDELALGPLAFRHAARTGAPAGEVSGHYHPKLRLSVRGRGVVRRCFLADDVRLIMPAFGAYTGGLDVGHPSLARLLRPGARAILTGVPSLAVPLAALA